MDSSKEKATKTEKAQKASVKSSKKMLSDVTSSPDQLQHPGVKVQKGAETVKTAAHETVAKLKKKKYQRDNN